MTDPRIYMLNALWFEGADGAARYARYAEAAAPFVAKLGGRLVAGYTPEFAVIGEWDPDLFFVVEWPDWEAFLALSQDPGYQKIAPLREQGLRKSLLIRCRAAGVAPEATERRG